MVDMSDSIQLGASAAHFHHLCGLPTVKGKPILLVLNKMDAPVSSFPVIFSNKWFSSPRLCLLAHGTKLAYALCSSRISMPSFRPPLSLCFSSSVCYIEGSWSLHLTWTRW